MNKAFVDTLIKNMVKAHVAIKATPWAMEAVGDKEYHVRYLGLRVNQDWADVFSDADNLLIKFSINRSFGAAELFLANKPPFVKICNLHFVQNEKWEKMLGDVKQKLKRDRLDFLKHHDRIDNLYAKIRQQLK
ncbi:MAG: hypothetical protein ACOZAN_00655 [Patescibacteria group bacterium]